MNKGQGHLMIKVKNFLLWPSTLYHVLFQSILLFPRHGPHKHPL